MRRLRSFRRIKRSRRGNPFYGGMSMDDFQWKKPDGQGEADEAEKSQKPWPDTLEEFFLQKETHSESAAEEEKDPPQSSLPDLERTDSQGLSDDLGGEPDAGSDSDAPIPEAEEPPSAQPEKESSAADRAPEEVHEENPNPETDAPGEPQENPVQEQENPAAEQPRPPYDPYGSAQSGGQQNTAPGQWAPPYNPYGSPQSGEQQNPAPGQPPQAPYGYPQNGWQQYPGYPPYPPYGYPPYPPQGQQMPFGYQPPRVYAPYGQGAGKGPFHQPEYTPKPPKSRGYRLFIGALVTLTAVFVLGFFSLSVYTALLPEKNDSSASSQPPQGPSEAPPESAEPSQSVEDAEPAPTGTLADPKFAGLAIASAPTGGESTAKEIYAKVSPSIIGVVCETQEGTSSGSGIICRSDGYIITNSHVIKDSKNHSLLRVILHDNSQYNAAVVGFDKTTDLAVLKIDAKNLPVAAFGNSDSLAVGDWVLAIGNPGGMTFASSLTRGVVSGLNRSVGYSDKANMTYIQTDTAISPGASGGALLNLYGQVVGVNTSKLVAEGYEGMGFSIPIARAKSIVDDLIKSGYVSGRARLGIGANQVTSLQQQLGWPQGVVIVSIDSESAFQGTEAKVNDIITKVDGTSISTMTELYQKLGLHKPGDTMKMTLYRPGAIGQQGKTFEVTATLLADNGETQQSVK